MRGPFREVIGVDLVGRIGAALPVASELRLPLGVWEIATVRLR